MRVKLQSSPDVRIARFIEVYKSLSRAVSEPVLSRRNLSFDAVFPFAADMDLIDDDEWRVCLNGTGRCERARIDRTGRNVLETCSAEERTLRVALAESMFDAPCGLRATLTETFEDGQQAITETTSMPLTGDGGLRKIVTYALLAEDIAEPFRERSVLQSIQITAHRFVDLGYGMPALDDNARLIA